MAPTVVLALDADGAGQEAMLRAARPRRRAQARAARRGAARPGSDPAELVQRDGRRGGRARRSSASVPFVRFRVERMLAAGDHCEPRGPRPDARRAAARVRDARRRARCGGADAAGLRAPGAAREPRRDAAPRPARGAAPARVEPRGTAGERRRRRGASAADCAGSGALSRREETERAFLALCIASPEEGARALERLDIDEHFTSELLRRAAAHLREGAPAEPMASAPTSER